jgi:hypothetical protein
MTTTEFDLHKNAAITTRYNILGIAEQKAYEEILDICYFPKWNDDYFNLLGTHEDLKEVGIWKGFKKLVEDNSDYDPIKVLALQKMVVKLTGALHFLDTDNTPELKKYINSSLAKKVNSYFYEYVRSKRYGTEQYHAAKAATEGLYHSRLHTPSKSEIISRKRDYKKYLGKIQDAYNSFKKFTKKGIDSINSNVARVLGIDQKAPDTEEASSISSFYKVYDRIVALKDQVKLGSILEDIGHSLSSKFASDMGQWANQLRKENLSPEDREFFNGAFDKIREYVLSNTREDDVYIT